MFYQPSISTLVAAGGAKMPSTTVVRGGRLVNVVSAEIYSADIAIYENTIVRNSYQLTSKLMFT